VASVLVNLYSSRNIETQRARPGLRPQQIPLMVARGERPGSQLDRSAAAGEQMRQLIKDCWAHDWQDRPPFVDIVRACESIQRSRETRQDAVGDC
jgi:hypothetical protein